MAQRSAARDTSGTNTEAFPIMYQYCRNSSLPSLIRCLREGQKSLIDPRQYDRGRKVTFAVLVSQFRLFELLNHGHQLQVE